MSKPYIINDANGNPINAKYPPNREKYGDLYEGNKTWAEEVLFHRFRVLCYDVCFTYKNKEYFLLKEQNGSPAKVGGLSKKFSQSIEEKLQIRNTS